MNSKIKIGGLAVISAALAGVLAFGSGANAQTPSPTATPNSNRPAQGQQRPGGRGGAGGMMIGNRANSPHAIAAKALGITEEALRTELQAGKSIADVAASKGIALTTISSAILDAQKADLAKAVTDGKLTQAQADQKLADASTRINDLLNSKGLQGGPGGPRGAHFGDPANAPHVIAAKLLGLDEAALRTELQAGKTIADLATSKGVALTTISSAILDAQKADLAKAVTDGKLTQAQADQMLADAPTRINDMLTGKAPAGRPQGGRGGQQGGGKQASNGPAMGRQAGEQGQQHGGPRGGPQGGAQIGNPANAPHAIAAKLLGLDEAALRTELQAGKTISDVAASKGVALNTIATAILDAQKADVAKAVTDGKLTQAQADKILADAPARINTMLTTAHAQRGPGGPRGNGTQMPKPSGTPAPRTGGSNG